MEISCLHRIFCHASNKYNGSVLCCGLFTFCFAERMLHTWHRIANSDSEKGCWPIFFFSRTESLNIDTHLIGDCLFSSLANAISNHYQESSLYNWHTTNAPISVVFFPSLGLIAHVDTKIPNVVICFFDGFGLNSQTKYCKFWENHL